MRPARRLASELKACVKALTAGIAEPKGHDTIDDEHRELFRLANRLIAFALTDPGHQTAIASALDALLTHVGQHFANEAAILERLHYGQLAI